jgi:hypothetical protein
VESFNGTFRAECLDAHWFKSLAQTRQIIERWRREYNESRPHRALGEKTPNEFACQVSKKPKNSLWKRCKKTGPLIGKFSNALWGLKIHWSQVRVLPRRTGFSPAGSPTRC